MVLIEKVLADCMNETAGKLAEDCATGKMDLTLGVLSIGAVFNLNYCIEEEYSIHKQDIDRATSEAFAKMASLVAMLSKAKVVTKEEAASIILVLADFALAVQESFTNRQG